MRRAIKKYPSVAVISFIDTTNVLTLLATIGLNVKVIVSERIDPKNYSIGTLWEGTSMVDLWKGV